MWGRDERLVWKKMRRERRKSARSFAASCRAAKDSVSAARTRFSFFQGLGRQLGWEWKIAV